MDDNTSTSRRYDVKYASNDALNTKRKYSHVQSKVKVYIDKLKKEDLESRKRRITRHRSEPSELAVWKAPDDNNVKFNDYTDWKLVQQEMVEMKSRMNELQSYGDTMSQLLSNERSKRMELQKKLSAMREHLGSVNSCTWSDPGEHCIITSKIQGVQIEENDKVDFKERNALNNVVLYIENEVFHNGTEWTNAGSDEEIVDDHDETILLQPVEVKPVRKGMKHRMKKILYCCAPCIKAKAA